VGLGVTLGATVLDEEVGHLLVEDRELGAVATELVVHLAELALHGGAGHRLILRGGMAALTLRTMGPLVDADWLEARVTERDASVVVADVRWYLDGRSGHDAFVSGHVPGATFVDLETVLASDPTTGAGRHPLPDPGVFAGALGRLGIGEDVLVVTYDDAGGAVAARLWWMLRAIGQDAAVLDGGLGAWTGALETGPGVARATVARTPVPWPRAAIASADEVAAVSERRVTGVRLLDARAPERFRGEVEPIDPRAGHIPGAVNAPVSGNLDPDTGRFRPPEELRVRYLGLVGEPAQEVIAYCGSGVNACHTLLALEVAGLPSGRLFPGSWSEWSARGDRPVATGKD
jgi:thiosulfate/3-mercaptopyruvate sulfurtransferase